MSASEIFISYGREPEVIEFVKKLKHDLEENKFTVWLDLVDINSGSDWHGAIGTALHNCRALIAVITNKYINSRYCSSELYTADGDRKKIYPVIFEEVDFGASETARGVKYVISGINWTMFRPSVDDYAASLTKLAQGLRGMDSTKTSTVHIPTEQLNNLQLSPQPLSNPKTPSAPPAQPYQNSPSQVYPGHTPWTSSSPPPPPYQSESAPSPSGPQTQPVPASLGFPCADGFQSPGSGYHGNYSMYPPMGTYPHSGVHPLGNYPSMGTYPPPGSDTYPPPAYPPPGFGTYPPPGSGTYPSPSSGTYPLPGFTNYPSPSSGINPPRGSDFYPPPITYHPAGTYQPSTMYPPLPGTYPPDAPPGHSYPPGTYPQTPLPVTHYTGYQTSVPPLSYNRQPSPYSPLKGEGFAPPTVTTPLPGPQRTSSDLMQTSPDCHQLYPPSTLPPRPSTPVSRRAFKVGTKVEAVDKRFPYFLCVATIMGKKDTTDNNVKIHFDGWGPEFDYECAPDSIFIHPVGWCEKHGWELQKPNGLPWSSWKLYLEDQHASAADESSFSEKQLSSPGCLHFECGMKLEAKDRLNPHLVAVATIAAIQDGQLLIHFDGWSDRFDYWCSPDCTDIHPPMWCGKNGTSVMPPNGYNGTFKWSEFLTKPELWPSPAYLFTEDQRAGPKVKTESTDQTDLKGFQVGMKLEAKDRANPHLICIATVTDISDGRLLIHFDGWGNNFDYRCDPKSPDLHPVGWCKRAGVSLQPPQGTVGNFSWDSYLQSSGSIAAPESCFISS